METENGRVIGATTQGDTKKDTPHSAGLYEKKLGRGEKNPGKSRKEKPLQRPKKEKSYVKASRHEFRGRCPLGN